jgi:gamma-glutamyltranspeptidase/glutathione hydrolase
MASEKKSNRPLVMGVQHVAASGHYMSAQAALEILEAGGNAIDAGVAAGLATGVLEGIHVSVAGVAPILIRIAATGEVVTISGLGTWPAAASAQYFIERHGGKIPAGVERTVMPAAPDAWITALERWGTMSFAEVARPAIRIAREGFPVYQHMANFLRTNEASIKRYPSTAAIYYPGGKTPDIGDVFLQSDLAASLQFMADEDRAASKGGRLAGLAAARDCFYRGDIAKKIIAFHESQGSLVTSADLAGFRVGVEPAVHGRFAGADIYTCGPWCQGPMLLQELNLLNAASLARWGHNSVESIHHIIEAVKLAAADREAYYGDPRFVNVPLAALLDGNYSAQRAALIDPLRAAPELPLPGNVEGVAWPGPQTNSAVMAPGPIDGDESVRDTSYSCVVDRWGNAFSVTPSDGNTAAPVVPGLGFVVSGRGSQSRAVIGHPSSVAPGKRPRLTPNPALAVIEGKMCMPFGTPGGDVQTQAMLQCLVNVLVYGMDPQTAVEAPRFASYSFPSSFAPNDYRPAVMCIEDRVTGEVGERLAGMGHKVEWWPSLAWQAGSVCMIKHDTGSGVKAGAADPRRTAYAVGW